jgi:hypothetical protein
VFVGLWFEDLHVQTNSAIVITRCSETTFSDTVIFDTGRASGATGTAIFKLDTGALDAGGNIIRGVIPGRGTDTATTIDYGIEVKQNGNRIEGSKGYKGYNVLIDAGVTGTTVILGGAVSGAAWVGWVDNSGNTSNTLIDTTLGTIRLGAQTGTATFAIDGATYRVGTGTPESAVTGNVGDIFLRTDGAPGSTIYSKGAGVASSVGWHPLETEYMAAATMSGVAQSINFGSAPGWTYTLTADQTFTSIASGRVGGRMTIMIKQDAVGNHHVTWPSAIKWAGGAAPTLSTAANAMDVFVFMLDGNNSAWYEVSRSMNIF